MNKNYNELINQSKFFNKLKVKINNEIIDTKETYLPRLNICSGPNVFPFSGWINYDREDISSYIKYLDWQGDGLAYELSEMPEHQQKLAIFIRNNGVVDFRVHDIKNKFAHHNDNSIESIYVGQSIEHFNRIYETPAFMKECYRMLKFGGVLRMTTPDLDLILKAYINNEMDKFAIEQPEFYKKLDSSGQLAILMFGSGGPSCSWNNYEGHFFLYTQKSMTQLLEEAGFKSIKFYYETGKSLDKIMEKEVIDCGMSHSFIVEAVKS